MVTDYALHRQPTPDLKGLYSNPLNNIPPSLKKHATEEAIKGFNTHPYTPPPRTFLSRSLECHLKILQILLLVSRLIYIVVRKPIGTRERSGSG